MSYVTGEDLIVAVIKAHANFDADNVSQADWSVIDSGDDDHYAILKSGGMIPEFISVGGVYNAQHLTIIEVWQEYLDDGTTAANLYARVGEVVVLIQNAEKLGDTSGVIIQSNVAEVDVVMEMWRKGGGPAWLKQDVNVLWQEQVTAT